MSLDPPKKKSSDRKKQQRQRRSKSFVEAHVEALVQQRVDSQLEVLMEEMAEVVTAAKASRCSVLESAASMGRDQLLRALLRRDSDSSSSSSSIPPLADHFAGLQAAAFFGRAQSVRVILEHRASRGTIVIDALLPPAASIQLPHPAMTPLMIAASKGHADCVQLLLDHNPSIHVLTPDTYGWNALMHAASWGHAASVDLLLTRNQDLQLAAAANQVSSIFPGILPGMTALMIAAANGHAECMKLMLSHRPGATLVAAVDARGRNALMHTVLGYDNFLGALLAVAYGTQHPPEACNGTPPPRTGRALCLELLLQHSPGLQLAALDADGFNALMHACCSTGHAFLDQLLAHSPDTQLAAASDDEHQSRPSGMTALMLAAYHGHGHRMRLLMQHSPGAQAAAVDDDGDSALVHAASKALPDGVKLLLDYPQDQEQLDAALLRACRVPAEPLDAVSALSQLLGLPQEPKCTQSKECMQLLLGKGAMLPEGAAAADIAVVRPINQELVAQALLPGRVNKAVVGLALACSKRRR